MPRRQKQSARWVEQFSSLIVEWGAIALLFLAPLWFLPMSFSSGSAKTSLILAGTVLILGAAALKSWAKREITLRIPWIFVGVSLFVIASIISLINAANPYFALSSLLLLCFFLAFGLVISKLGITKPRVQRILGALLAASSIASLIAILQYVGYLGDPMLDPLERAMSTFGNRNYLGSFLGVMALPSLALLLSLRRTRIWYVAWVAATLVFLGAVLVQQTGIFVALIAGIAFVALGIVVFGLGRHIRTHYKTILVIFLAAIIGLGVGLTLWSINPQDELAPTAGLWSANSGYTREVDWWTAWEMFKANSMTGVGLGNFKVEFLDYKGRFLATSRGAHYVLPVMQAAQAHNEFLQIAAELGVPGIVLTIFLVILAIGTSWIRCRSLPNEAQRLEFLLISAGLVVASVHAIVSFPFHLPITALTLVTLLGLVSSSYFGERAMIRGHIVGSKARVIVLTGSLLLCLLGAVLGREFFAHVSYSQGVAQMEAGENTQAQHLFERSIAMSFCSTEAKFQLATVTLLLSDQARQFGDQADAKALLQIAWSSALASQDEYPTAQGLLSLAGIAVMRDDDHVAEDILSRLLASRPWSVFEQGARYLMAALDAREGDLEAAKTALRVLIQDHPTYVQSYILLGQLLLQEGSREDGRQVFEQGMQVIESELLRIEAELKTASSLTRDTLRFDQQRLFLERQSLGALIESQ